MIALERENPDYVGGIKLTPFNGPFKTTSSINASQVPTMFLLLFHLPQAALAIEEKKKTATANK